MLSERLTETLCLGRNPVAVVAAVTLWFGFEGIMMT